MNKVTCSLLFCLLGYVVIAQVSSLNYTGQLLDEYSHSPVDGAIVRLTNDVHSFETITNSDGVFVFSEVPAGAYQIVFQSLGYQVKTVAEIQINTGVPRPQAFTLVPHPESLQQVVVKAESRARSTESVNSIYTLTVEETFRFPGTFYDPARLATHYAGVINENDQANNLVIRGNTPNGLGWYLEGVEIVNPNHLSNAGTVNDRSSQSGGGVNILSAQMLDNSTFLTGAFPAFYGNATSGIFDMRLRDGASDQTHFTAQLGLLGLDAALEGPLGKNKDNSYLLNYRYSTIGLLSKMGVDLGDEAINFQDFSFHLKWKLDKGARLSLFGMGGVSENIFEAPELEMRDDFKDEQNINFDSRMAASGIRYENTRWDHTLAYSGYRHFRKSDLSNMFLQFVPFENDEVSEQRLGIHSRRKIKLKTGGTAALGIRANLLDYDILNETFAPRTPARHENSKDGYLFQLYGNVKKVLSRFLQVQIGLHNTYFTINNSLAVEPRFGLSYQGSPKNEFGFSYGLHSRIPPPQALLIASRTGRDNSDLSFIRSHHFVLSHNYLLTNHSKLITELYYQRLFNVPIAPGSSRSLSPINSLDYIGPENLVSEGTGSNLGLEITYQQYFSNSTYFLLNGTIYDSKYTGGDGIQRNTRYNGKYGFNLTGGKEFSWQSKRGIKTVGLNLRGTYFGGFWESPIDIANSVFEFRTVYQESDAYSIQLPDFYKIDFRIYYKRIKTKYTSMLGLDLLNATNRKNIAYHYFDLRSNEVKTKYHLGLIPNLSYRIEF